MENGNFLKNSQIIGLGLCIAAGTIVSTMILSQSLVKIKRMTEEVIDVTGSAEKSILSDYIVWNAEFSRRDPLMNGAYGNLKGDLQKVKEYLLSKGVQEKEIVVSQVETGILYRKNEKGADTNEIETYVLTQKIEVHSHDIEKVAEISRQSTELIDQGIQLISQAPQYFYTKLTELKMEMIAKASRNAKERAEKMVQATGSQIGVIRSAKMGVFQITPVNSFEVSDWGANDTTSLEKKVTAVVHLDFTIAHS